MREKGGGAGRRCFKVAYHRRLVARKFDGTKHRKAMGRTPRPETMTALFLKYAEANRTWGCDRIGAVSAEITSRVRLGGLRRFSYREAA